MTDQPFGLDALDFQLALVDDMFCDIYAEAYRYAPYRVEILQRDLLKGIVALRKWRDEELEARLADAWDEGYEWGMRDEMLDREKADNPYRKESK